ncbi:MAG: S-layer homology domain-containing protein, partial [Thermoleophilia bacterium]
TVQVTTNSYDDTWAEVSGDRVVWDGYGGTGGGGDWEIFTWTPTGGPAQLTTNSDDDFYPRVSGDRVVWPGYGGTDGGGDGEIFTWTPTGGTVQLTTNSDDEFDPRVSGDRVVWHGNGGTDGGGDFEIFTAVAAQLMTFSDVPGNHPYYLAINDLFGRSVINGYLDSTFRPDNPVTRQQFAKMVVRAMAYPVSEADVSPFTDVPTNVSSTDPLYPDHYVAVCAARGITVGKTLTTFAPYDNMTRAQLFTMVARAADLPDPPLSYTPPFGQYDATHYPFSRKAASAGLLNGLQGVGPTYDFFAPATRGEVSVVLYNLLNM